MEHQLKAFGNILILFALVGLTFIFIPVIREEAGYQFTVSVNKFLKKDTVAKDIRPIDTEFGIVIPKIGANARVIPNIDPGDSNEYLSALKKGVAHAKGSDLPGGKENIYLFAHSTDFAFNIFRFNAVFFLLHNMEVGDEIDIYYVGRRYVYYVYDKKIVDPSDVEYLTRKYSHTNLTLQTCWPPGTTLNRLLVFARPKTFGMEKGR